MGAGCGQRQTTLAAPCSSSPFPAAGARAIPTANLMAVRLERDDFSSNRRHALTSSFRDHAPGWRPNENEDSAGTPAEVATPDASTSRVADSKASRIDFPC